MASPQNVGIYIFENMTMLDGYAPLQFLAMVEQFNTFTFAKHMQPLKSDCGAVLTPDHDLASCPPLDILVMPGGGDVLPQMRDAELQTWLRRTGPATGYVTSVCTGALILAEAGLLDGYKATTHWGWIEQLKDYPDIEVVDQRVVIDRNRISGGGVTAGIDFALALIAEVVAPPAAQAMQLMFEYRPEPPFDSGSPRSAPSAVVEQVSALVAQRKAALKSYTAQKRAS